MGLFGKARATTRPLREPIGLVRRLGRHAAVRRPQRAVGHDRRHRRESRVGIGGAPDDAEGVGVDRRGGRAVVGGYDRDVPAGEWAGGLPPTLDSSVGSDRPRPGERHGHRGRSRRSSRCSSRASPRPCWSERCGTSRWVVVPGPGGLQASGIVALPSAPTNVPAPHCDAIVRASDHWKSIPYWTTLFDVETGVPRFLPALSRVSCAASVARVSQVQSCPFHGRRPSWADPAGCPWRRCPCCRRRTRVQQVRQTDLGPCPAAA